MDIVKYSQILDDIKGFDAWLTHLGISVKPDRIHQVNIREIK